MHEQDNRKSGEPMPLVVTATLDEWTQTLFNDLRQAYFPPERNYLDAHLTLFHALPGVHAKTVEHAMQALVAQGSRMPFQATMPYSLGQGVAIMIDCKELEALRMALRTTLEAVDGFALTNQDRAKRKLHVTVQNKVSVQDARRTLQGISMAWNPETSGWVTGLALWRYAGGPWEPAGQWRFADVPQGGADSPPCGRGA